MTCYRPWEGFRNPDGTISARAGGTSQVPLTLPCGRCIGCRMSKAQDWSTRIVHEAQLHEDSAFITLTYSDEFLPDDYSISVRDVQLFIKRLRDSIKPQRIRFYACGEYGGQTFRPHYHAIIFGYFPPDPIPFKRSERGDTLYISEKMLGLWSQGHVSCARVTPATAAYVAKYAVKKMGGKRADAHYTRLHPVTGEIVRVRPEFSLMSRRPGIGSEWFELFEGECFPSDFVIIDGTKRPVPRYYRDRLRDRYDRKWSDASSPLIKKDDLYAMTQKKREFAETQKANNTPERLATREELATINAATQKRDNIS